MTTPTRWGSGWGRYVLSGYGITCYMEKTRRDIEVELGHLIRDARRALGLNQEDVAEMVSVDAERRLTQGKVSDHENGRWQRGAIEDFVGSYGRVLRISEERLKEVLGFIPPGSTPTPPTFEELVRSDPSLDERSKDHLINQYGLLQAASRHHRANPSSAAG